MPDTTPGLRHLFDAVESGEEGGDWPAFLAAMEVRDAAVRAAAFAEAADALLKVDPVEWALAGQYAGNDAAALVRRLATAPTATAPTHQES